MTTQSAPTPAPARRMRSDEELEHLLVWLPTSGLARRYRPKHPYMIGVRNAVEWVLGRQRTSPVTCRHGDERPDGTAVYSEQLTAHEGMACGPRQIREDYRLGDDETDVFGLDYFTAVENTLGWVLGWDSFGLRFEDSWPWPTQFDQ